MPQEQRRNLLHHACFPSHRAVALDIGQGDSIDQLQRFISRNILGGRPYSAQLKKAAVAVKARLKGRLATGRLLIFIYAFAVHMYLWVAMARLETCASALAEAPKAT